jgi:hypothetical protein
MAATSTSVASLTLGRRWLQGGLPSVGDKSNTRIRWFLVFLMSQTFARNLAAEGSKCLRRNTSMKYAVLMHFPFERSGTRRKAAQDIPLASDQSARPEFHIRSCSGEYGGRAFAPGSSNRHPYKPSGFSVKLLCPKSIFTPKSLFMQFFRILLYLPAAHQSITRLLPGSRQRPRREPFPPPVGRGAPSAGLIRHLITYEVLRLRNQHGLGVNLPQRRGLPS